jgi:ubiquinone/menaquinone biosynthesis C-methylase UbiE
MDQVKFSAVAHRTHRYCNPLSISKMERMIEWLPLRRGARVFDAGCGKAELLIRLVEHVGASAVGVDRSGPFLQEAREQAARRVPGADLALHETDIAGFEPEEASFDLAICMGSTHLYQGLRGTLAALRRVVRPGGLLLVTEGYWKREPSAAYLEALHSTREEFTSHAENVDAAVQEGWIPLYSTVTSEEDWDEYEGRYLFNVEQYAFEHPEDPDVPAMLERIRRWRDTYLRWGRDTLGFGMYLLRKGA